MGSSSSSDKKTYNTTRVVTKTNTVVAGNDVIRVGKGAKANITTGITGDDAVQALAAFNNGLAQIESFQLAQQGAVLNTFGTLASGGSFSGSPSSPMFEQPDAAAAKDASGQPKFIGILTAIAAVGGVYFLVSKNK